MEKNVHEKQQINDDVINSQDNAIDEDGINGQTDEKNTITDSIISENEKQEYENNINESQNSENLNETTQIIENATFNKTTKLPFYFLTILFLVLSIIFLIKFIKYQLKRKNKLSSK